MTKVRLMLAALLPAVALTGCGPDGRPKVEDIQVKEDTAVNRAKKLLENYSKGQALGSEVSTYDQLVKEVRAEDPTRGDILEKGLAELQKTKGPATAAKAKELLNKLAPKMTGG